MPANSPLVEQIVFAQNGQTGMTTSKQYDALNRLTNIVSTPSGVGQSAVGDFYRYNLANQRTNATLPDGSYWVYTYDSLGQVLSGKKYWSDGTPVTVQQFEYAFDNLGNGTAAKQRGARNQLAPAGTPPNAPAKSSTLKFG